MYTGGSGEWEPSMSIDCRTRRHKDLRPMGRDEMLDGLLPGCLAQHGELAARGLNYKQLPSLGLSVDGREVSLLVENDRLVLREGSDSAAMQAVLDEKALSELLQDQRTTMGLAMISRVTITRGEFSSWIGWEPVFRALLDGRPVHEAGAIALLDSSGEPLSVDRSFNLDDDPGEMSHFLQQAGFLHLHSVFNATEMAAVSTDLEAAIARAKPDDGASWWAADSGGKEQAVRVLWFNEQSDALQKLLYDERLQFLARLTGDGHDGKQLSAEGLVKPLDIQSGLSDLPWHKDCGQGGHSLQCNGLTVGISVTGADKDSGALGVVPGSHRANVQTAGRDESLDLKPVKLETCTGDITVHCSDTLHRAHRPIKKPRQVVYTSFQLPPLAGDELPSTSKNRSRKARAELTNVRERIAKARG
jgi:hypothetical protein